MERERTERAVARIEAALARLEAAAQATAGAETAAALVEARGRHDQLKSAVTDALDQLDAMIAGARS